MSVKEGYKRSLAGEIPSDWTEYSVGDYFEFQGGSQPHKSVFRSVAEPGFIRLIQIRDYKSDRFLTYVPQVLARRFCSKDDIMIGRYGPPIFQILRGLEGAYNVALIKAVVRTGLDKSFAYYFLKQDKLFAFVEKLSQRSSGQTGVDLKELRSYPLPLPPTLAEQEVIAGALSDADAWIESLEQLVAKKRQIKQGAIQELLTGKRRLPGFRGEWKKVQLSSLGNFAKGSGVTKAQANSGEIPCIRYGEIYTRHRNYIRTFYSGITREVAASAARLRRGDILFAGSGETKEEIGKCVAFVDEFEAYAGGDIVILRTTEGDPFFLGYYLNTEPIAAQKASRGQGDAVVHISASALGSITVCIPDPSEQRAIGLVLREMDSELNELESKLAKARHIKQAMMQELLTGRIRLVETRTSAVTVQEAAHA